MPPTLPSPAAAVLETLPDLRRISRFCSADEISVFLTHVNEVMEQDRMQIHIWNMRGSDLLQRIEKAPLPELRRIHDELNRIELDRFLLTCSVSGLHQSCTHYRDLLAKKALVLVTAQLESEGREMPDIPYALISMGSDGREEQTLITDQDYLIVYGDGGEEKAEDYFKEFSGRLVDCLEQIGFKRCTGDIMPSNPNWRGSVSQWRRRLLGIVRYESEDYGKNMMDMIVISDARFVAGDQSIADDLVDMVRSMLVDYARALWGMAKAATEMKLALGFLKRLWTESSGEHKGEFNLKLLAWAPLVMNVRILSINQGIPATSTVDRITHLEKEGSFSATMASDLRGAYHILTKHRILLQIRLLKGIQKDSYHLNPYELPPEERERIRTALIRIEELQKIIHTNFNIV